MKKQAPTLDDLKTMADEPTPDMTLLKQYIKEMSAGIEHEEQSLNAQFSMANQKKSNTLGSIAADATNVLMGPNRAMSALKLVYGLGKLAYEAYSVQQVVNQMDNFGEKVGDFSRFSGKYSSPNPA